MASSRLSDLKRKYYRAHTTGVSATTPFGQLERTYMVQYIQTNEAGAVVSQVQKQPMDELEIRWLKAWITTNGGTPPNNTYQSSHWHAIVATIGKTPVRNMSTNMMTFFANAA